MPAPYTLSVSMKRTLADIALSCIYDQVRIFHNLKNRHILKFFNWYETRNHLWIIFEYCAGGDLLQLIEQDKKLPESTLQKFGRDLT